MYIIKYTKNIQENILIYKIVYLLATPKTCSPDKASAARKRYYRGKMRGNKKKHPYIKKTFYLEKDERVLYYVYTISLFS